MMQLRYMCALSLLGCQLLFRITGSHAMDYTFTTIDVPFAHTQNTTVVGLATPHILVGTYLDARNNIQGFLRMHGHFTTLLNVTPHGINALQAIVGTYRSDKTRGFVFQDGSFTPLEFPFDPFSGQQPTLLTEAEGINDAGVIVGDYRDGQGVFHGFRYDPGTPARYTTVEVPWAHTSTGATAINNADVIIGNFIDAQGTHGYIKNGSSWTVLDAPGAQATEPFGMNDTGVIVGLADGHTFVYDGTTFQTVVHPDGGLTQATGITNAGVLVGRYFDGNNVDHGFVAHPVAGTAHRGMLLADHLRHVAPAQCTVGSRQWHCRHGE
jgi:hypothetical protein